MPLKPGDILANHYRIEAEIGRGAYGRVYRGRDTRLDRPIAIKELAKGVDELGSSIFSDYVRRFEREARVQAGFNHPNIVHVYELIQESADRLYLVMEYVNGESLRDALARRGPLPVDEAVRITSDILAGLAVVHADPRDIVHRDIKPSNVLLTKDGHAKLADFGLAQVGDESMRSGAGQSHPGTPAYMSPEQETTSAYLYPASDLFSVGCVLFEMLTGVAYKRAKKERKGLAELRPDAPPWMGDIVAAALAKDPDDRPKDGVEMGRMLSAVKAKVEAKVKAEAEERAQQGARRKAEEEAHRARLAEQEHNQQQTTEPKRKAPVWSFLLMTEAEKSARARREAEWKIQNPEPSTAMRRRLLPWVIGGIAVLALVMAVWHPWKGGTMPKPTAIPTPNQESTPQPVAIQTSIATLTMTLTLPPSRTSTATAPVTPSQTATPSAPPRVTPSYTSTPTSSATPTVTPSPKPTDTPPPSATPKPQFTVKSASVNVRSGPGTSYSVTGSLRQGETYEIIGRNAAGDWWQFIYNGRPAWVSTSVVSTTTLGTNVPVVQSPPTPSVTTSDAIPTATPGQLDNWLLRNNASMLAEYRVIGDPGTVKLAWRWHGDDFPSGVSMEVVICKADKLFPTAPSPDCVNLGKAQGPYSGPHYDWVDWAVFYSGEYYVHEWVPCTSAGAYQPLSDVSCGRSQRFNWGILVVAQDPRRILITSDPMPFEFQAGG